MLILEMLAVGKAYLKPPQLLSDLKNQTKCR